MFRELRRKVQKLSDEDNLEILARGTSGVLALVGDSGYPYAVPINYVYCDGKIYFHSAIAGHKIDSIRKCDKASFCVIDQDVVVPEKYTTYYKSVIAFGKIRILEDEQEKRRAIEKLAVRFYPEDSTTNRNRAIDEVWKSFCMLELSVEHMTGKSAMEFVKSN